MNDFLVTYNGNKTVKVKQVTKGLAEITLKKIMPNIKVNSIIKIPKEKS
jgi:response regulator of citrate/malate metabolism